MRIPGSKVPQADTSALIWRLHKGSPPPRFFLCHPMRVSTLSSEVPFGRPPWPWRSYQDPPSICSRPPQQPYGKGLVATIPLLLKSSTRAGLGLTHLSWDIASTEESLMWPQRKDCQQTLVQARGHSVLLSLSFPYLTPRHYGYAISKCTCYLLSAYPAPSTALGMEDTMWIKQTKAPELVWLTFNKKNNNHIRKWNYLVMSLG